MDDVIQHRVDVGRGLVIGVLLGKLYAFDERSRVGNIRVEEDFPYRYAHDRAVNSRDALEGPFAGKVAGDGVIDSVQLFSCAADDLAGVLSDRRHTIFRIAGKLDAVLHDCYRINIARLCLEEDICGSAARTVARRMTLIVRLWLGHLSC